MRRTCVVILPVAPRLYDLQAERAVVAEWAHGIWQRLAVRSDLRLAVQSSVRASASRDREHFSRPGQRLSPGPRDGGACRAVGYHYAGRALHFEGAVNGIEREALIEDKSALIRHSSPGSPGSQLPGRSSPECAVCLIYSPEWINLSPDRERRTLSGQIACRRQIGQGGSIRDYVEDEFNSYHRLRDACRYVELTNE